MQQSVCSWQSLTVLSRCCPFRYSPKSPALQSETVHYKRGVSQHFSLPSFKIDFSEWKDEEVTSWLGLPFPLAPFLNSLPSGGQAQWGLFAKIPPMVDKHQAWLLTKVCVLSRTCAGLWSVVLSKCWLDWMIEAGRSSSS